MYLQIKETKKMSNQTLRLAPFCSFSTIVHHTSTAVAAQK